MPETPFTPAQLALEQTGLEFLRIGKFRKARDAFKSLNKLHPSRALPLLIEANLGLANEMMSKGLVSEANQVLAYLKTIAPASCDLTLTAVPIDVSRDAWSAMVPLAAQRLATATEPDGAIRAADEMILGATSPDHPGHLDAEAILTALELGYGSATTARTAELLRTVPRSSPFSHWVFFFKGMTALEAGDHARAADCFRRVPGNSLLYSSMPALLTICGAAATAPPPAPRTVQALCAWAGHLELAESLLVVEPLWRKKRRSKAFTLLTKKIPGLFRWGARDLRADLTRFLTSELVHTRLDDTDYRETLLDYISVKSRTNAKAVVDQAFFALDFADYAGCAHSHFQCALTKIEGMSPVAPLSPAMLSRIFTHLAEAYITAIKKDPGDMCSPPNAKRALEHAIKHDPDNLRAWLMQCDLLAMGKDTSAYHRFLDNLSKRFPTQKEVLIRNGDCCNGRKTYTKALRNFESAAKIDSVDPRITLGILRALLGMAEEAYKKRKPSKANWELIESLSSPDKSCGESALWRLRVRRIVLEVSYGIAEEALVALAAATLPLSPSAFLLEAACRFAMAQSGLSFKQATLDKMFPSHPAPESLTDFLAVIDEVNALDNSAHYASAYGIARQIFVLHETRLLQFVVERKDLTSLLIKIFSNANPNLTLASPVIEKWYLHDPTDPLLRFLCMTYRFPWLQTPPRSDLNELVNQLRDSHDPDILRLLMLLENDRHRPPAARYGGKRQEKTPKLDLDYDPHDKGHAYGDDAYDDDGDFEDDLTAIDQAMGKMSPAKLFATLGKMMDYIDFPGPGNFSDPLPFSLAPPKPPRKPTSKQPGPDPRQTSFDAEIIPPPKQPPQP